MQYNVFYRTFVMHVGVNAEAAKIESILVAFHCIPGIIGSSKCVTVPAAHGALDKRQTHFSIMVTYNDVMILKRYAINILSLALLCNVHCLLFIPCDFLSFR